MTQLSNIFFVGSGRSLFERAVALGLALGHGWAQRASSVLPSRVGDPETVIGAIRFFEAAHNAENRIPAGASFGFWVQDGRLMYQSAGGRVLADVSRGIVTVRSSRGNLITVSAGSPTPYDKSGSVSLPGGPESLDDPWVAERVLTIAALLPDWVWSRCRAALESAQERQTESAGQGEGQQAGEPQDGRSDQLEEA